MKKVYMCFIVFGIIILSGVMLTRNKGSLVKREINLYVDALKTSKEIAKVAWSDFDVATIPVAIRKGSKEFVLLGGKVKSLRKPAFPVPVASIYKVRGEINALIPDFNTIDSIGEFVDAAAGDGGMQEGIIKKLSGSGAKITNAYYEGIILHEAFHVYQMKHGLMDSMNSSKWNSSFTETEFSNMLKKLSKDSKASMIYSKEHRFLYKIFCKGKISKADIIKLYSIDEERRAYINKNYGYKAEGFLWMEDKKESYEGSANYILYKTLGVKGDKKGLKTLVKSFLEDSFNVNRYYAYGAMKCVLLDGLSPNWHIKLCKDWNINDLLRGKRFKR